MAEPRPFFATVTVQALLAFHGDVPTALRQDGVAHQVFGAALRAFAGDGFPRLARGRFLGAGKKEVAHGCCRTVRCFFLDGRLLHSVRRVAKATGHPRRTQHRAVRAPAQSPGRVSNPPRLRAVAAVGSRRARCGRAPCGCGRASAWRDFIGRQPRTAVSMRNFRA